MPSVSSIFVAVSAFAAAVSSHPVAHGHAHAHDQHVERSALPNNWFHDAGHPAHRLFIRAPPVPGDITFGGLPTTTPPAVPTNPPTPPILLPGMPPLIPQPPVVGEPAPVDPSISESGSESVTFTETGTTSTDLPATTPVVPPPATGPAVGTPEWLAQYPKSGASPSITEGTNPGDLPPAWVAAYKAAVANGLIAQIPPTLLVKTGEWDQEPKYLDGFNPESPEVCSTTFQCYNASDITKARDGMIGISFDDGPAEGSKILYDWLAQNHQKATHFLIGGNILDQPELFLQAIRMNGDLAVHTFSHPYMTAQSDLTVLAEIGWTMQIIYDATGGRVPRYWRPPYGDMDQRVRSIAEHVFGLTAVMWNQDTNDWAMPEGQTAAAIAVEVEKWLSGPKTPGLIILEHELNLDTSNVFLNTTWPGIVKYGWKPLSIAQMYGENGFNYANAKDNIGPVEAVTGIETLAEATGHNSLPVWASGTASTSWLTTSAPAAPTDAPAPPTSPAPPTNPAPPTPGKPATPVPPMIPPGGGGSGTNGNNGPPGTSQSQNQGADGDNSAASSRPQFALLAAAAVAALTVLA